MSARRYIEVRPKLLCRWIQNALIYRTLFKQFLFELRVRDYVFSINSFASASVIARVDTMSSSKDTGLPLSSSAIVFFRQRQMVLDFRSS